MTSLKKNYKKKNFEDPYDGVTRKKRQIVTGNAPSRWAQKIREVNDRSRTRPPLHPLRISATDLK